MEYQKREIRGEWSSNNRFINLIGGAVSKGRDNLEICIIPSMRCLGVALISETNYTVNRNRGC